MTVTAGGARIGPRIGSITRPRVVDTDAPPVPQYTSLDTWQWWQWWTKGALSLAARAEGCEWQVRIGFSRTVSKDVIGVWVDGYGLRGAAFWTRNPDAKFTQAKLDKGIASGEIPSGVNWKADGTLIYGIISTPWPYASHTEFGEWIDARGDMPVEWYEKSRARVLAARITRKVSASDETNAGG